MRKIYSVIITLFAFTTSLYAQEKSFPKWEEGFLDIHTISTGRGNCQYVVMPDGTTMMIDAGDFDGDTYKKRYAPMTCSPITPDSTLTPAQNIANYINNVWNGENKWIDYFFLTHYHSDHYGMVREGLKKQVKGGYTLVGLTEIPEYIPIKKVIDREYPKYDFPLDLRKRLGKNGKPYDPTFQNYLAFLDYQVDNNGMTAERLAVGSTEQFILKNRRNSYPTFNIRGIKAGNRLWSGHDNTSVEIFTKDQILGNGSKYNENILSCAIVLQYGNFRYYAGGDNTGLVDQDHEEWSDVETPMANVVGKVSAMSLNHHGNRDATNSTFLNTLDPLVVLMQSWSSDHPGQEVGHRLISPNIGTQKRDIFMTYFHPLTGLGIGPWFEQQVKEKRGNFVLRVYPDSHFEIYVLDNNKKEPCLISYYGPYNLK